MRKAQKLNSGINLLFYFFFSLLSRPYWIYNEWMTGIDYFSFLCTKPIGPVGLNEKKFHLPNIFNRKGALNILLYIEISFVNWKGANRRNRREKMLNTKNKIPQIPWNRIRNWTWVAEPTIFNGAENVSTQCRQHNEAFRRKLLGFQLTASLTSLPSLPTPHFFLSPSA